MRVYLLSQPGDPVNRSPTRFYDGATAFVGPEQGHKAELYATEAEARAIACRLGVDCDVLEVELSILGHVAFCRAPARRRPVEVAA